MVSQCGNFISIIIKNVDRLFMFIDHLDISIVRCLFVFHAFFDLVFSLFSVICRRTKYVSFINTCTGGLSYSVDCLFDALNGVS